MLESRSRHLSRWLRTSVCAIAQQGSAGGSEAGSPLGRDMRMGGCGYVYRDACIFLIGIRFRAKLQDQRIRRDGADQQRAHGGFLLFWGG